MEERRTQELIDAWFDGILAAEEGAELEKALLESPAARESFWQTAQIHALLREKGDGGQWRDATGYEPMRTSGTLRGMGRCARAGRYGIRDDAHERDATGYEPMRTSSFASRGPFDKLRAGEMPPGYRLNDQSAPWLTPASLDGTGDAAVNSGRRTGGRRISVRFRKLAALAAAVGLVATGLWLAAGGGEGAAAVAPVAGRRSPVEILHRWGSCNLEVPETLPGTLRMTNGRIMARLSSGIELVLLGPAELVLRTPMEAKLLSGRLLADASKSASGFMLHTPDFEMWDNGALFGVTVTEEGSDVFVFEGEVQVVEADGEPVDICRASEGARARRDGSGAVKIKADWPEAERLLAAAAGRGVLNDPEAALKASVSISDLWAERWLPRVVDRAPSIDDFRTQGQQRVKANNKENEMKPIKTIMALSALSVIGTYSAAAGDGVWVNPAGGVWEESANWQDGAVAEGDGATATFGTLVPGGDVAVSVGSALTLGNLVFGGADNDDMWQLSGATLTLTNATLPVIEVNNREAWIDNNLITGLGVEKRGSGALVLTGTNFSEAVMAVTGGTLALSNQASQARMRLAFADTTALRVDGTTDFWALENTDDGAPQVTVNGTARVGRWLDRDGATEYTFSGAVAGGGTLVKQGGNRQVLEGTQTVAAVEVAGGTLAVVPKDDIVAWFGFDDPAEIGRDSGPSGVTLAKEGDNATWHDPQGKFGGALRVNGASCLIHDKTEAVPMRLPVGDAAFTLAAWIKLDADAPEWAGIACWGHMEGEYNSAALRMNSASTVVQAAAGHTAVSLDAPDEWQHVALTYDPALASDKRKIYVNGNLKRSDNPLAAFSLNSAFVSVGRASPNSSEHQNQYFKGLLDEVVFARAALSQAQIQSMMTDGATAFYAPPAAADLLSASTALTVGPSGRLVVGADQKVSRIDGAGGVVAMAGGASLTIEPTADVTLESSVAGLGGLVKKGAGTTLTVAARQGYTGSTRVEEGTLEVVNLAPRVMEGIVGYWTFDNPNNVGEDLSGNDIQLKSVGTGDPVYYSSVARVGGCVMMSSRYFVPEAGFPSVMPTGNAPCSISMWVNPTANIVSQGGFIYWGDESGTTRSSLNIRLNSSFTSLTMASNDGGITVPNLGFDIRTGVPNEGPGVGWHHLCYTYDPTHPTQKQRIYVNGALMATGNQGDFRVRNSGFRIGCGRSQTTNPGNSYIDDTIIFNRAITADEVLFLSKGNLVVPAATEKIVPVSGVVARYAFDDPGHIGKDTSGYGNHLSTEGASVGYQSGGKWNGALSVSGSSSYLTAGETYPRAFPLANMPYTIACWFNPGDATDSIGALFYMGRDAIGASISGRFNSSFSSFILATLNVPQLNGSTGYDCKSADLPAGWHHFATTFDPYLPEAKRKMYVDGRLIAVDNVTDVSIGTNMFYVGRGRDLSSNRYIGRIDEFVVMNRAATLAEIAYLAAGMPEEMSGVLPGRTALEIAAGARTVFKGGTPNRVGGVSGAGELALEGTTALVIGGGRTNVFAGTLTGASSVMVEGGSAQTLPLGAFTGALAVSNATLLVTADDVTAAAGIAVAAGGRLGGAGATATPVSVAAGGTLLSRTAQAALTLSGSVTLAAGAGFAVEAPGSQAIEGNLKVTGALALPATGFVELYLDEERQGNFVVAEASGGVTVDGSLNNWDVVLTGVQPSGQSCLKVVGNKLVLGLNKKGLMVLVF